MRNPLEWNLCRQPSVAAMSALPPEVVGATSTLNPSMASVVSQDGKGSSTLETTYLSPQTPFSIQRPLTLIDAIMPPVNSPFLYIYSTSLPANVYRAKVISALQQSLISFMQPVGHADLAYPYIIGRIHQDKDTGHLSLRVTPNSKLRFVVSTRDDIAFSSLRPDLAFPNSQLPRNTYATGLRDPPLPINDVDGGYEAFWVQVTLLDGGFVICANKHHWLVDGNGFAYFIERWFARTKALIKGELYDQSIQDDFSKMIHDNTSLLRKQEKAETFDHPELRIEKGAKPTIMGAPIVPPWVVWVGLSIAGWSKVFGLDKLLDVKLPLVDSQLFHFTPTALHDLKVAMANDSEPSRSTPRTTRSTTKTSTKDLSTTTNDAICALLWRCVTRARLKTAKGRWDARNTMLAIYTNVRRKVYPPLHDEFFGNAIVISPTILPATAVAGVKTDSSGTPMALNAIANSIRKAISFTATAGHTSSLLSRLASLHRVLDAQPAYEPHMGPDIILTSWQRMYDSEDKLDLGVGRFQRVRWPRRTPIDGVVLVMPAFGKRDWDEGQYGKQEGYPGGLEVSVDLAEVDMELLMRDEEWRRYAAPKGGGYS